MSKKIVSLLAVIVLPMIMQAKTLVAYYSYTNNVERIVNALSTQITCLPPGAVIVTAMRLSDGTAKAIRACST